MGQPKFITFKVCFLKRTIVEDIEALISSRKARKKLIDFFMKKTQ
jgi:hypothetical protein